MVRARLQIGEASVRVHRATIDEQLSGPVAATIEIDGAPPTLDPEALVGASARLVVTRPGHRCFCGIVRAVETGAASDRLRLRVEPGFAALADDIATRPFVRIATPELLRAVLAPALHELGGREVALQVPVDADRFTVRDLCVQYGESRYDFCRRVMAEAGLVYRFDHSGRTEKLLICDGGPIEAGADTAPLPAFELSRARFHHGAEILHGRAMSLASLTIEPGRVFRAGDCPVLVTAVRHQIERGRCTSSFTCLPARVGFRPAPIPKPIALEDWALVVTPSPDDGISDDPDGRVHVRFLYDGREGAVSAGDRSPLIAVGQAWSGASYGVEVLPRAGMLVRIEYLAGDPDRPVVAGCLPTGENTGPAPLPARASRLAIRTRSLRSDDAGADAWNEIALADDAGAEELFVRAGRDLSRAITRDQLAAIDHDDRRLVGRNQALTVAGTHRAHVAGCDAATTGGAAESRIDRSRAVTVKGQDSTTYRRGRSRDVTGQARLTVTKRLQLTADDALVARQGTSLMELAHGDAKLAPAGDLRLENAGAHLALLRSARQAMMSAASIELVCGGARILLGAESVAFQAPSVAAGAPAGQLQLDQRGAATTGTTVTSSATVANVLHGVPVIFSDSVGSK
jgi:uncharacterized protein involved in type VI secretion and phage assembly